LPVAPLACLYLWCGMKDLCYMAFEMPKTVGLVSLPFCIVLTGLSVVEGLKMGGMQPKLSILFWLALSIFLVVILLENTSLSEDGVLLKQWFFKATPLPKRWPVPVVSGVALSVTIPLVLIGFWMQIQIGRENLRFDPMRFTDVRAAQYVNLHTDRNAVIMAGHAATVYYYTRRRVIWFPPISNPEVLMDGIRRHKVN